MKKRLPSFIAGILVAIIAITFVSPAFASEIKAAFNSVNIKLNGNQIASVGESYTLSDGTTTPYSIVYNNTTYLPMRKLAEILELNVGWEGDSRTAVLKNDEYIAIENSDISYEEFKSMWDIKPLVNYDTKPISNYKDTYVGEYNGNMTNDEIKIFIKSLNRAMVKEYTKNMAIEISKEIPISNDDDMLSLHLITNNNDSLAFILIDSQYNIVNFLF